MYDKLPLPFSKISAACYRALVAKVNSIEDGNRSTSPRTGRNLAPCPLPPVQAKTDLSAYVGT